MAQENLGAACNFSRSYHVKDEPLASCDKPLVAYRYEGSDAAAKLPAGRAGQGIGEMDLRGWISDEIGRSICQSAVEEPT